MIEKRRYFLIFFIAILVLFGGCTPAPDLPNGKVPPETSAPVIPPFSEEIPELPLSDADLSIPVPDFLDEDQQLLYRRAYSLYNHMFGGDTSGIEYIETMDPDQVSSMQYETVEIDNYFYTKSQGRYGIWEDFDNLVHSVFTDGFWDEKNIFGENGEAIYLEKDGYLYYIDGARGSGYYYNENFPDKFLLLEKTDTTISFTLIGHYTPVWPLEGETGEQRNHRRRNSYDYTFAFPIKLVLTEKGWRFDEFHTTLADERDPGDI